MKHWIANLITTWLLLTSLTALTQSTVKYGFELREYLKTASQNEQIPLLVEGDPSQIPTLTEQLRGKIRLNFQNLYSLEIPAKYINTFAESDAVKVIEFSTTPGRTLSDTMLIHTNVDSIIRSSAPLKQSYTGKGVILGVIDSGVELAHPDFQDSTGKTRVLYVWDQKQAFDPTRQALNYNYGVEWDSASINAGLSTHDDRASEFGHGSNVTGAAASNGFASGQFRGVAPEVNIISVATDFNKPNWLQTVAESVDYIFKKADVLGMPCVINASVGTYVGSHDGKDIAARIIDGLIQQKTGRSFVCAAGNAGSVKFHVQQNPNNDTVFTWFENSVAQWQGFGGFYYEVWSDTANFSNLEFAIGADKLSNGTYSFKGRTAFSGIQNRLNIIYNDTLRDLQGNELATIETYAEESQGRYKLEIAMVGPDSAQFLYRFETKGTGKVDIYSSYDLFRHSNMLNANLPTAAQYSAMHNYAKPDSMQTMVSSFTCSPNVISIGNHYNRATYTDVSGTFRNMNVSPGQISTHSSLGPNRLNDLKPNVSSAGDFMFGTGRIATIRSLLGSSPEKVSPDTLHWRNGGTSMASPTVAGMVALYLEMCPKANQSQIINDLQTSARKDNFTTTQTNFTYGNGKADAFNFLKPRVFNPAISFILPSLCIGDSLPLHLPSNYLHYLWNTGDSTSTILASKTGNYYATVENQFGCKATTDTSRLFFNTLPPKPIITVNSSSLTITQSGLYQWYLNGNVILAAQSPKHQALISGDYHCVLTDPNTGCKANSDTINLIITYLEENRPLNPTLSPIPAKDKLTVSFAANTFIQSYEVFNLSGKLVLSKEIQKTRQQFNVNVSLISRGMYLLKISTENGLFQEKILIE